MYQWQQSGENPWMDTGDIMETCSLKGSHSSTDKKSRTFPGLSRTPWEIFQDLFGAHKWLNIKKKPLPLLLTHVPPFLPLEVESFKSSGGIWASVVSSPSLGSGVEPQPKLNLVHFSLKIRHLVATIFPGLSRTLNFNFHNFPGPKWFSRTFQVLEF